MIETQFEALCERVFSSAEESYNVETEKLMARHNAEGRLRSGSTVVGLVEIMEKTAKAAVDECLAAISKRTENSPRYRPQMLATLTEALDAYFERMTEISEGVEKRLRLPSIPINDRITAAKSNCEHRIAAFGEGWTAPTAKPWHERHPILYGLSAAAAGAVIVKIVDIVFNYYW